jgi:ankyrin repeat protein
MLFYGANPNFYYDDLEEHTPLEYAVSIGNDEAVHELLNYGALITKDTITKVCATENFELLKVFVSFLKKETIDHLQALLSHENYRLLFLAIKLGHHSLVRFFTQHTSYLPEFF